MNNICEYKRSKLDQTQNDQCQKFLKIYRNYRKRKIKNLIFKVFSLRSTNLGYIPVVASKFMSTLSHVVVLDLTGCNLADLQFLPKMKYLKNLDLTKNYVDDAQTQNILYYQNNLTNERQKKYPYIELIYLSQNYITEISSIDQILNTYNTLKQFDVQDNPVNQKIDHLRYLQIYQSLQIMNRYNKRGEDMQSLHYEIDDDQRFDEIKKKSKLMKGQIQDLYYTKEQDQQWQEFLEKNKNIYDQFYEKGNKLEAEKQSYDLFEFMK